VNDNNKTKTNGARPHLHVMPREGAGGRWHVFQISDESPRITLAESVSSYAEAHRLAARNQPAAALRRACLAADGRRGRRPAHDARGRDPRVAMLGDGHGRTDSSAAGVVALAVAYVSSVASGNTNSMAPPMTRRPQWTVSGASDRADDPRSGSSFVRPAGSHRPPGNNWRVLAGRRDHLASSSRARARPRQPHDIRRFGRPPAWTRGRSVRADGWICASSSALVPPTTR
jgi:hypothetical protein